MNEDKSLLDIDLEQISGFLMMRSAQIMERQLEKVLAPLDVTRTQFILLSMTRFLSQKLEFVTQSQIAEYSGLDLMMISQVSRRMEDKGFLRREPHPKDSRSKVLSLTALGEEQLLQARAAVRVAGEEWFSILDEKQQASLNEILKQLYFHYKEPAE